MSYRVIWTRAEQALATTLHLAWETGAETQPILDAAATIFRLLTDDPHNAGESRSDGERVVIESPLTVVYEVFEAHNIVMVYRLRHHRGR